MPRIDGSHHLGALIRAQMVVVRQEKGLKPSIESSSDAKKKSEEESAAPSWAQPVAIARLKSIRSDDPQRNAKAFRIFLESVLLKEFGVGVQGTNEFETLIEQVLSRMSEDKALRDACMESSEILLKTAHGSG